MNLRYFVLCIGLQLSLVNCFCQKPSRSAMARKYGLSDSLIVEWNKDKNGCLSLRDRYIDTIRSNKYLIGMSKEDLVFLFGRPDSILDENNLKYFTGADCDYKKNVQIQADNAWVIFLFRGNKLTGCYAIIQ